MPATSIGLKVTGVDDLRRRLTLARSRAPQLMHAATAEALELIEARAKAILDAEIYGKSHPEGDAPNKGGAGSLYSSFYRDLQATAATALRGVLGNASPHGGFIEFGTDNEGTGSHFVAPVHGKALAWSGPGGAEVFSRGHEVKGIVPIRFMERALTEHKPEVIAIYRRHFAGLFT
jgi:hypothetical protein